MMPSLDADCTWKVTRSSELSSPSDESDIGGPQPDVDCDPRRFSRALHGKRYEQRA
jgi:hypothetical protein